MIQIFVIYMFNMLILLLVNISVNFTIARSKWCAELLPRWFGLILLYNHTNFRHLFVGRYSLNAMAVNNLNICVLATSFYLHIYKYFSKFATIKWKSRQSISNVWVFTNPGRYESYVWRLSGERSYLENHCSNVCVLGRH